ncbi:MAG: hypothetical protein LBO69_02950 [Ignavibacteria bacterium]|jgi:hypothetical protein|nr:hypothetical protein [Ignavibacteria bacterium]
MKERSENYIYPLITPQQFEQMLARYGMQKKQFCSLCNKTRGWFCNSFVSKQYLTYSEIDNFVKEVGVSAFTQLCAEILPNIN